MKLDIDGPVLYGLQEWDDRPLVEDDDIGTLLQEYVDDLDPKEVTRETTVTLIAYRRVKVSPGEVLKRCDALERLLESLDEDFGGDEYKGSDEYGTDAMRKAEREFCDVVAREYVPYRCDRDWSIKPEVFNVAQWLAENDPDQLNDGEDFAHLRDGDGDQEPDDDEGEAVPE